MVPMRPTVIIQSTMGRIGVPVVGVIAAALLALEALSGGPIAALFALPWLGLVVVLAWLLWASASVRLETEHLVLDNPLSTVRLGWGAVQEARSRWGLVVDADGREHKAWAAPARGTASFGRQRVDPQQDLQPTAAGTPAIRMDLDARAAALLIGEEALVRGPGSPSTVARRLHRSRVVLLVTLALLSFATAVL